MSVMDVKVPPSIVIRLAEVIKYMRVAKERSLKLTESRLSNPPGSTLRKAALMDAD